VRAYESDDFLGNSAGLKDLGHPSLFESRNVAVWNNSSNHDQDIVETLSPQQFTDPRKDGVVGAGKNGDTDGIHIFLERRGSDLFGSLAEPTVDDFHARVAQGTCHNLRSTVVAIQTGFGNQDAKATVRHF
jgi:hypothetical protein